MGWRASGRGAAVAVLFGVGVLPGTGRAEFVFPPILWNGSIGYDFVHYTSESDSATSKTSTDGQSHLYSVELFGKTYIWQPWFGLVDARLNLGFNQSDSTTFTRQIAEDGTITDLDDTNSNSGETFNLELNLSLVPRSRFPFRGFFSRSDSRSETDNLFASDTISTRWGFTQDYTTLDDTRYKMRYDHNQARSSSSSSESSSDTLDLTVERRFAEHNLYGSLQYSTAESNGVTGYDSYTLNMTHQYTPSEKPYTLSQALTYGTSRYSGASLYQAQYSAYGSYTVPSERPWQIYSSFQALNYRTTGVDASTTATLISLSGGTAYTWENGIRGGLSFGGRFNDVNGVQDDSYYLNINLDYSKSFSDNLKFLGFDYFWGVGLGSSGTTNTQGYNGSNTADFSMGLSVGFTHGLSRSWELGEMTNLSFSISQGISPTIPLFNEDFAVTLTHTLSLGLNSGGEDSQTMLQFSASDAHTWGDDESNYQLLTLEFNRQQTLSEYSSLTGSISLHASKEYTAPSILVLEDDVVELVQDDSQDEWTYSSSADLSYRNRRLFGVRGLEFTSDIVWYSDTLLELIRQPTDLPEQEQPASLTWNNRLFYRIGKLSLGAGVVFADVGSSTVWNYNFSVRRNF